MQDGIKKWIIEDKNNECMQREMPILRSAVHIWGRIDACDDSELVL